MYTHIENIYSNTHTHTQQPASTPESACMHRAPSEHHHGMGARACMEFCLRVFRIARKCVEDSAAPTGRSRPAVFGSAKHARARSATTLSDSMRTARARTRVRFMRRHLHAYINTVHKLIRFFIRIGSENRARYAVCIRFAPPPPLRSIWSGLQLCQSSINAPELA